MERKTLICTFLIFVTAVRAQENGGGIVCPTNWTEGALISLRFVLNATLFPAVCDITDNTPRFTKATTSNGTYFTSCSVPNITQPSTCSGSFAAQTIGCGCIGHKDGNYILEYNFIATPDYNGWWRATAPCIVSYIQVLEFNKTDCDDKSVTKLSSESVRISGCDTIDEKKKVKLTATLNASTAASCSIQPLTCAIFKVVRSDLTELVLCSVPLPNCNTTVQPGGCVCKSVENNVYTLELNYTYDPSGHANGTLDLTPNCVPQGDFASRAPCRRLGNGPKPSTTPTDSISSTTLLISLGVAQGMCVVIVIAVGAGFYCRKPRSWSQPNAPLVNASLANVPLDNAPPDNVPPNNAPPGSALLGNAPPDDAQCNAFIAWPSSAPADYPLSSVDGSAVSEASTAREVSIASEASTLSKASTPSKASESSSSSETSIASKVNETSMAVKPVKSVKPVKPV